VKQGVHTGVAAHHTGSNTGAVLAVNRSIATACWGIPHVQVTLDLEGYVPVSRQVLCGPPNVPGFLRVANIRSFWHCMLMFWLSHRLWKHQSGWESRQPGEKDTRVDSDGVMDEATTWERISKSNECLDFDIFIVTNI